MCRKKYSQLCSWVTANGGCADEMPSRVARWRTTPAVIRDGEGASMTSVRYMINPVALGALANGGGRDQVLGSVTRGSGVRRRLGHVNY
jgi:hypothetical protein